MNTKQVKSYRAYLEVEPQTAEAVKKLAKKEKRTKKVMADILLTDGLKLHKVKND